jgi:hypothetical protein
MWGMQAEREEYALPTLLGSSKQVQFWREVEREPDAFDLVKIGGSKLAVPKPLAKTKDSKKILSKANPQASPAKQKPHAANPKLQVAKPKTLHGSNAGRSSSSPAKPSALHLHFRSTHPKDFSALAHPSPLPSGRRSHEDAEKDSPMLEKTHPRLSHEDAKKVFMGAVCTGNQKKAEELLSEYGPSMLSGLTSHAIHSLTQAGHEEMRDLLLAHGSDTKKEEPVKNAEKGGRKQVASYLNETFVPGTSKTTSITQKSFCSDRDMHKKENQSAPRRGRSASVSDIFEPISVPKRASSNTRARRKSIY